MSDPAPSIGRALVRGATARCPRCGASGTSRRWLGVNPKCRRCDLTFEREQGYWLGAMMVNLGITEGLFIVVLFGVVATTYPDVPWRPLLVGVIAMNLILPILLYPAARMLWVAMERSARKWAES